MGSQDLEPSQAENSSSSCFDGGVRGQNLNFYVSVCFNTDIYIYELHTQNYIYKYKCVLCIYIYANIFIYIYIHIYIDI